MEGAFDMDPLNIDTFMCLIHVSKMTERDELTLSVRF